MNRQSESGFTLLEVMVVLAITGLLVAVLAGVFHSLTRTRAALDAKAERSGMIVAAQSTVRRQLETARPSLNTRSLIAFDGSDRSVSFVSVLPAWLPSGGPNHVQLAFKSNALVVTRRIASGLGGTFDWSHSDEESVLVSGVRSLDISYFGSQLRNSEQKQWQSSWQKRSGLPDLVRINLVFEDATTGQWPELLIAPLIHSAGR